MALLTGIVAGTNGRADWATVATPDGPAYRTPALARASEAPDGEAVPWLAVACVARDRQVDVVWERSWAYIGATGEATPAEAELRLDDGSPVATGWSWVETQSSRRLRPQDGPQLLAALAGARRMEITLRAPWSGAVETVAFDLAGLGEVITAVEADCQRPLEFVSPSAPPEPVVPAPPETTAEAPAAAETGIEGLLDRYEPF